MDDIFGGSEDDDNIAQPILKGRPVNGSNTPSKILLQLPNNGRGWNILTPREYPSGLFRADNYRKIYMKKGVSICHACSGDGDYIVVFESKRPSVDTTNGGGGGSPFNQSKSETVTGVMDGVSNGSQLNKDPAVFIINPKKDSTVVRGSDGVDADGSAYDTPGISLSWTSGSESKDVTNDSWKTTLPLSVGEHELTAAVDGDSKSVKFTVVLKPAITGYTTEQIQELSSYTNNAKISQVEQDAETLAKEAGLKETTDDYAGFALCQKVNGFASKASGDFSLFYSGSGDKAFIEKKVDKIFGAHLSEEKKSALIAEIETMKTAGFVDATDAFHNAMNNTLNIFFAENSVGRTISEIDIPVSISPTMTLMMDAAKTVVNIKLNIQLSLESNGAPLLMRQEARRNAFDAVAIEVVGAVVGGVVIKAGSKAFKVIKSYFGKFKHKFTKYEKPSLTADGRIIPYGKTAAESKAIIMPKGAKKGQYHEIDGQKAYYDNNGFIKLENKFDTVIDKKHIGTGKEREHFQAANEQMRKALNKDQTLWKKMGLTKNQKEFFEKDPSLKSKPPGLTWHHHQDVARMQLVNRKQHGTFSHTGGMSIWGGGYKKK